MEKRNYSIKDIGILAKYVLEQSRDVALTVDNLVNANVDPKEAAQELIKKKEQYLSQFENIKNANGDDVVQTPRGSVLSVEDADNEKAAVKADIDDLRAYVEAA